MEGPVSEDYENEIITIRKPEYPIRPTIQNLVGTSLQCVVFTEVLMDGGTVKNCGCFIFKPDPPTPPSSKQHIKVDIETVTLKVSVAFTDEETNVMDEMGCHPR